MSHDRSCLLSSGKQESPTYRSSHSAWGLYSYYKRLQLQLRGFCMSSLVPQTYPWIFSPSNPVIFPCIVSKESLMSLVRNIPFETAVSPKLSHPMHKKDCLQPVVLPEWSLGAGPALFQKYQQHRVFKKTCLLWWACQWKYIVIPGSFWVLLRNWWMTDWDFPDFQQAIKPL